VPPVFVALTVVALGTSLPELVVALQAAFTGHPGLLLGNVVGSNIANVLLVGGVSAAIYPLAFPGGSIRRDSLIMVGVSLAFVLVCVFGELTRWAGAVFLVGLVAVMIPTVRDAADEQRKNGNHVPIGTVLGLPTQRRFITLFILAGLVGLPVGADLVVDAAVEIAGALGVSDTVVGLTVIAVSTSLPELATTVVAAFQRRTEVALGTIVGSNIFNLLAIMGAAALVSPTIIPVAPNLALLDFPLMIMAAVVVTLIIWSRRPLSRGAGIILSVTYAAYLTAFFAI
jgi:cation:H+ antiporter